MNLLIVAPASLVALVVVVLLVARLGGLNGPAPSRLGVSEGRLKPPSKRPNSVSSQAQLYPGHPQAQFAAIEPLPMKGDAQQTIARLRSIVEATPGARVVKQSPDYLYAQYTSELMRFVDDVEFWVDPQAGVVQVRSASRLGNGDRGVNRARVEAIRAALKP